MIINAHNSAAADASQVQGRHVLARSLARLGATDKTGGAAGSGVASQDSSISMNHARDLDTARDQVTNALALTRTQEEYLQKISDALDRMAGLAQAAQDPATTEAGRGQLQSQFSALADYIGGLSEKDFNGVSLFDGATLDLPAGSQESISLPGMDLGNAAAGGDLSQATLSTISDAHLAHLKVNSSITTLREQRASIGTFQAQLHSKAEILAVSRENLSAATQKIGNETVATESTEQARQNILVQSGTAMRAQANAMPQQALRLLP